MAVEAWLFARLNNAADLRAIVTDSQRICPVKLPQRGKDEAFTPAVVYQRKATNRSQHTGGAVGVTTATFEVRCWSTDYLQTKSMSDAIRLSTDSQQANQAQVKVRRTAVTDEADDDEAPFLFDDVTTYASVLTLDITFEEPGPQLTT